MKNTIKIPNLRFLACLLLPLALWAGEKPLSDPFAERPEPPIEIMQVPVNDSEDRVVVTACLITLKEDDLDALLQQFPESKKSVSGLQFYGAPDTVEPASTHQSPQALSQVLHIDAPSFLEKVGSLKSAEILHTPHLHGRLGKTVTYSEGSELIYSKEWEADPENPEDPIPVDFETRHLGLEFSFIAEHQKDDAYTLDYSFIHTELVGFHHILTGKAYQGDWKNRDALRNYNPVFESQSQNSSVRLSFGETMILGGIGMIVVKSSERKDSDVKTENTRTWILQTISLEKYDGPHTNSKPKN